MVRRVLLIVGILVLMSSPAAFAAVSDLPETGQTACYDTEGNVIPCAGTGQDGELQKGVAWPSPRFTPAGTGDACMLDNLTGLMWMRNPSFSTYTWQGALDYANGRNAANLCGFDSGWRLPNINELHSLLNEAEWQNNLWLESQGFGTLGNNQWSSTTYMYDGEYNRAYLVAFNAGYDSYGPKTDTFFAFPVRGPDTPGPAPVRRTGQTGCWDASGTPVTCTGTGQDGDIQTGVAWPEPRFAVGTGSGADCVTDHLTDLMWVRSPGTGQTTWQAALDSANAGTPCGFSDWRLPNLVELQSLLNYGETTATAWLNSQGFSNVQNGSYWSSNTYAGNLTHARIASMGQQTLSLYQKDQPYMHLWAVRDLAAPDISVSPGSLDFGNVIIGQTSVAQTVTITNTGTADLVINTLEIAGTSPTAFAAGQGATNGCVLPDQTLTPGASCTVDVNYIPDALGDQEALLFINANDPDTPQVQVSLAGTGIDNPAPIVPIAPANGTTFNSCSYYAPPLFQWALNDTFQKLEIRIFSPANPTKPVKVKVKDPTATQFQMTQALWKKVLRLAGPGEATLQWKIIGSNKGQPAVESEVFDMGVDALSPVANFTLDPPSQKALPTISWENNCATKFRVWFGSDQDFTKAKKLSSTDTNPVDAAGIFSRTLTSGQWNAIRKLVGDQAGSDIYWYVESWDVVKRYAKTKPVSFTLEP